jgi:hypothetical protein
MKIKLMIALVILALAFGMVLIACDDGEMPQIKSTNNDSILDASYIGTFNTDGYCTSASSDTTTNTVLSAPPVPNTYSRP